MSLSVTDNGPGIKAENISRVFEPFFTTKSNGTGLGLAVVRSVAQSHQGQIQVTNLVDGGACFNLCLPTFDVNQPQQQIIASTHQAIEPTQKAIEPTQRTQPQQNFAKVAGS